MRVFVTGAAGFIGFHVAARLVERGDEVVGFDSLNDYYDPTLKQARLDRIAAMPEAAERWRFVRGDLAEAAQVAAAFEAARPERVIHLAAQAGVRHSLDHPEDYVRSNLVGFANILEACRGAEVSHLTYASTSSVYGGNTRLPFSEHHVADHPLQFYAATKRANELMAHAYSHLFRMPTTGLRFFTVYGPWGRPDMALFRFVSAILRGEPIQVFNRGDHSRDFTYIDDIAEGVVRAHDRPAAPNPAWTGEAPDPATSDAPFRIYNIGNDRPVKLSDYIAAIEAATGREAIKEYLPLQPGDVLDTWADVGDLEADVGYRPATPVEEGVRRFVAWYRSYYSL